MSVKITYFVHGTTADNELGLSTGWAQGELSDLGTLQAEELGEIVEDKKFDVVFCSDLLRAVVSAELAFAGKYEIILDKRLRECNYGELNQKAEKLVDYSQHVGVPFLNGESLKDVEFRIKDFLEFLKDEYDNKHVAIMAHKAPQLALEVILNKKHWLEAINEDWRKQKAWQPGWEYKID